MRNSAVIEAIKNSGSLKLAEVTASLEKRAHKAIAKELVGVSELIKSDKINYEQARLRITTCKHLIQLLALERLENR